MNSVNIIGRLGRDPELKALPDGKAVCSFSLALDEGKDRPPSWVDVIAFEKTAENVAQYLCKGDEAAVSGRLRQETWEKDGQKRSVLKVVASRVDFLRKKGESHGDGGGESAVPRGREAAVAQEAAAQDDPFGDDQ